MKHRELADAKRELVEAVNGYDLALRAASAELSRACKAAADRFGPRIDRARCEIDRLCGTGRDAVETIREQRNDK